MVLGFAFAPASHADIGQYLNGKACSTLGQASSPISGCSSGEKLDSGKTGLAHQIADLFLYAAGTISFIFVLIGGFRYITATGDPGRIQSAKDTLLYAVLGLILSVIAFPIAGFVIKKAGG